MPDMPMNQQALHLQLAEWRDRLKEARYSGTRRARDSTGEEIEYKSDSEMAKAIAAIDAELKPPQQRHATVRFQTSKGL